jgi:hypothetical protein
MKALEVGDRVLYEGKTWRVTRLAHHALCREADRTVPLDEFQATLLLEAEPLGSQPPFKIYLPESSWDELRLLGD